MSYRQAHISDLPQALVVSDDELGRPISAEDRMRARVIVPRGSLPQVNPREALLALCQPRNQGPAPFNRPAAKHSVSYQATHDRIPEAKKNQKSHEDHAHAIDLTAVTSLDQLREALARFEGCPLRRVAKSMVFSDGDPAARVMFIGEAPGAEEDAQGLPFVGLSGQLLNKMLRAIGLERPQVYITNIVPWRPPGNRQPSNQEIATCLPFVLKHIALKNPDYLVCLGGTATKALLGTTEGITKLRGRWHQVQSDAERHFKTMVTFHPAYLLRSPGQKREAWRDWLMLQQALAE